MNMILIATKTILFGKYHDNHTIKDTPYKSQNTITVYHMYYPKVLDAKTFKRLSVWKF